jgi:hypothetical protein
MKDRTGGAGNCRDAAGRETASLVKIEKQRLQAEIDPLEYRLQPAIPLFLVFVLFA